MIFWFGSLERSRSGEFFIEVFLIQGAKQRENGFVFTAVRQLLVLFGWDNLEQK